MPESMPGLQLLLRSLSSMLLLLAPPLVGAASDWKIDDLMALMAKVPSTEAPYTERKYLAILKEPLLLSGTLSYSRPDRIEKRVLKPYVERFAVDGDTVTFENQTKKRSFALRSNPVIWAFVESIRATLAGDRKALQRFYRTDLRGTREQWTLNLDPLDAQMAEQVSTIQLSGSGNRVSEVIVYEPGGDKSVMEIAEQSR